MSPCSYSCTKVWVTVLDRLSSIVKYWRSQSTLEPMRRICCVMVLPDCSFHSQMRATKFLRPKPWRVRPCLANCPSTTIWVAMPAWSVPGTHTVLSPFMRW